MIIRFDWSYRDGTIFVCREPTYDNPGSAKLILNLHNDVEITLEGRETLQRAAREISCYDVRDTYELQLDNSSFYDDIEGQLTFRDIELAWYGY